MPEKYNKVSVTQRDLNILHFIFTSQGCITSHIVNKFFKDCAYPTAMNRIKLLCDCEIIKGERYGVKIPKFYYITRDGVNLLIKHKLLKNTVKKLPRFTESRESHDIDVIDVRIALEADDVLSIGEWVTEYELAREIRKGYSHNKYLWVPDGMFTISRGSFKRPFLLEYASRYYGKEILVKLLNTLEFRYPYYSVLVVCRDQLVAGSCFKVIEDRENGKGNIW